MAVLIRTVPRCRVRELLARGWRWAAELQPEPKPWSILMQRERRPGESWQAAMEDMTT